MFLKICHVKNVEITADFVFQPSGNLIAFLELAIYVSCRKCVDNSTHEGHIQTLKMIDFFATLVW